MRGQALWCKTDEVSDMTMSSCCIPVRIDKEKRNNPTADAVRKGWEVWVIASGDSELASA